MAFSLRRVWTEHRRLAILGLLAAVLVALVALLHAPPVRGYVLATVVERLRADAGIRAEIDRLDYNLLTLRVSLGRTTLTAVDQRTPFLTLDRLALDLPWSIVRGGIAVQSLEIVRPALTIVRDEDGTLNLPPAAAEEPAEPSSPLGPIPIDRLIVRQLQVAYTDRPIELSLDGRTVTLDMTRGDGPPLAGRLTMDGGVALAYGEQETTVSRLEAGLSFDGSALAFDAFTLESPELQLRLDGRVDLLAANPRVDARYEGRAVLDRIVPWVAPGQPLSGTVAFSGNAAGPLDAPDVKLALTGDDLAWGRQRLAIDLASQVSATTAVVDRLRLSLGDGVLEGEARIGLAEGAPSRADLTWRRLDLGSIARTAGVEAIRLAAVASGRARAEWTGADPRLASATMSTALTRGPAPANALPLEGTLGATLDRGRWTVDLDRLSTRSLRLDGTADGRLQGADLAAATLGGRLRADVDDLDALAGELRRAGIDLPADLPVTGGQATLDVALSGTLAAPSVRGTLDATDVDVRDLGAGTVTAAFAASPARVAVESFRLSLDPDTATGAIDVDLERRTLRGRLAADLPELAPLLGMVPAEWRPAGAATLEADIGGTLDAPLVRLTAAARDVEVAGQPPLRLELTARLADQVLHVERLELAQGEGRLSATGRYGIDSGRYAIDATGRGLTVRPIGSGEDAIPIDARFDLDLRGEGSLAEPRGRASIAVEDLDYGEYALGAARLDARVTGEGLRLTAALPVLQATVNAQAALDAPRRFAAEMTVSSVDLRSLARPGGPGAPAADGPATQPFSLTGAIAASVKASGDLDSPRDAAVDVDLRLIDVTAAGAPIVLDRPARLRYDAGRIVADDLSLRIGDTTLTAVGRLGDAADRAGLTVQLKGGLADFLPIARLATGLEGLAASGAIDLRLQAAGALEAPRVDATLAVVDASASAPDLPPVTGIGVRAAYDKGLLTLSELRATWQGATLGATASVPVTILGERLPEAYARTLPPLPDRARANVELASVTADVAAPFVDAETLQRLGANLAATVAAEATALDLEAVQADVTLGRAELSLAGVPLKQDRPTRLRLAGGRVEIVDWTWSGAGNRLALAGGAGLTGEKPDVQASLAGSLDLRMLGAFSPDLAAGGRAEFDIRASGPLAEPAVSGEVALRDGELAIRDPRIAVTDLRGKVLLAPDRVRFVDIRANANGGTLQVTGDVALKEFQPAGGSIVVTGRGLALEIPENLRSEVNLDLDLALAEDAPALTGTVTVLRGSYRAPISLTGQLLTGVEVEPAAPADAEPGLLDRLRLAIDVTSDEPIVVDNNYGRLEISAELEVAGTPSVPALAGRLAILEGGEVFLAGQTWTLERGTVDFTSATRIEPNLDLSMVARVQRYDVRLTVSGTPETLEANLTSPEGLSQADAVSLLLTGQLADESTVAQSDIARGQLLLLLSGELLGFAGRAIGLDSAQVSRGLGGAASDFDLLATDTDPSARLTVAKQLRRDVEVVFSQSLRDSNDLTWIALYRPIRPIELRATTRDNNRWSYEFRHELNFGGGGAARRASRRAPEPRVSAVRFTGTPGFDERELRDRVKLDEGDRFDFYRWQQDRDRLAAFFHDRGYYEARIRADRATVEGTATQEETIALTYAIERGPATSLVIEGGTLPGDVRESMEEAWTRAVFDGFLREDLERMAREALARDGHLQAEARTEIREDTAAGTKQIAVQLAPGPRYTDRRLEFEGQERLTAEELRAVVEARRLALAAWLRPSEVESALEAHYKSLGYQSAEVSIKPPRFEGSSALLPVEVNEGPQFVIADVDVTGVSARSLEEVREAFGIRPGAPYVPSMLEPARREVEVGYLREGYNDVRVSVKVVADREAPAAHVTLAVDEGRQQVLEDVRVTGAEITNTGTVRDALNLKQGAPIDLSDTYRAQKRLYDMGVFRRADVELEPTGNGGDGQQPVRATVALEEVPPYRLRYGVRLADETGPVEADREIRPGLVVDLLRRNLFGRAISAGLAGQVEAERRLVRGILSTPLFFGLPVTSSLFLTRSRQDFNPEGFNPFVEDASELTAEQRFRPRPAMAVSYDYRFKRTRAFQPSDPELFDVQVNIARLTSTFAWDTRDDPFNARSGWFHSSGVEYAAARLGSDLRFVKYIAQQFYFRPVGERVVLASAFRLGAARGFDQDIIQTERFFVGGSTSVRGFAEDGLGERDVFGDPAGGAGSLILNQEIRFPIYRWVRGVGFVDAGNVFPRAADLSLTNLEVGTGMGLRIDTPFGLARIDFGMPVTRRDREPFGRWYFSLGQAF